MAGQLARIKQQIAALEKKAQELVRAENSKVIEKVKGLIAKHGLSVADLGLADVATSPEKTRKTKSRRGAVGKRGRGSIGGAMYRDPASGKTWTGRGKPPAWIAGAADRAPFLLSAEVAPAVADVADSAKPKPGAAPVKAGRAARTTKATGQAAAKATPKRASSTTASRKTAAESPSAVKAVDTDPKTRSKARPKGSAPKAALKKGASSRAAPVVPPAPPRKKAAPAKRSRGSRSRRGNASSGGVGPGSAAAMDTTGG